MAGPPANLARHYPHIRIVEVAYDPWGGDPQNLMQTSVDLVITDHYLDQLRQANAQTPLMLYTNISNSSHHEIVFGDALNDWFNFASSHGLDPEAVFYHAARNLSDGTPAGTRLLSRYGNGRYAMNPTPAFQQWIADYERRYLDANPQASGLFVDNSTGSPMFDWTQDDVVENLSDFAAGYSAAMVAINQAIAPRWALMNTAGGGTGHFLPANPAYYEESLIHAMDHSWNGFENVATWVPSWQATVTPPPYGFIDSSPKGGDPTDPRTQMATLAYYYQFADPDYNALHFFGGYNPESYWVEHWCPAAAYNIGRPTNAWAVLEALPDPSNPDLICKVYQRSYEGALVLYKPLSFTFQGWNVGTIADNTATTHALSQSYQPLNADGSLAAAVTTVTLRNGEGAILIPTGPPPLPPVQPSGWSLLGEGEHSSPEVQDPSPVELGIQFVPSVAGAIVALKFWKTSGSALTHVGTLWDGTGQILARVTFASETTTGWQEQSLRTPVMVSAGQEYTASYHNVDGHYPADQGYFAQSRTVGPLTVPANGSVYAYGAGSSWPTKNPGGTNYYVDVVFQPQVRSISRVLRKSRRRHS